MCICQSTKNQQLTRPPWKVSYNQGTAGLLIPVDSSEQTSTPYSSWVICEVVKIKVKTSQSQTSLQKSNNSLQTVQRNSNRSDVAIDKVIHRSLKEALETQLSLNFSLELLFVSIINDQKASIDCSKMINSCNTSSSTHTGRVNYSEGHLIFLSQFPSKVNKTEQLVIFN